MKPALVLTCLLVYCYSLSLAQIGATADSIIKFEQAKHAVLKDSSATMLHYFRNGLNYRYYFQDDQCYYTLLIAGRHLLPVMRTHLKEAGFCLQPTGSATEYTYINKRDSCTATMEYQNSNQVVVFKILSAKQDDAVAKAKCLVRK